MKRPLTILAGSLLSGALHAQSPQSCEALEDADLFPNMDVELTSARHYSNRTTQARGAGGGISLPPHCHVEGEIDRRRGADGESYAIRFAINMPDNWNGRYLFQGGGGLNGNLGEPVGNQATGDTPALLRGFAVVSTDSGHEAQGGFDASFMLDTEAVMNFLFLGNMRVTNASRPVVEAYYDAPINHSYFVGCSTGGREGMIMAQRYPTLYDGIVSGAPAIRTGHSNLGLRWLNVNLNRVAPANAEGEPQLNRLFSDSDRQVIIDGLLQSCDALDGVEDGLVFNLAACPFDVRQLACEGGATQNCLAPAKVEALATGLAGPVDSRGHQVYSPFIVDTGMDDSGAGLPGLLIAGGLPPEGPSTTGRTTMDVDLETLEVNRFDNALGDATSFHLSTFIAGGGKQIFYHGVSDPWFSAMDTLWYYNNMAQRNAGLSAVNDYSRLYMVPGMGHCQGGEQTLDRFDMLSAIVEWVENDSAPQGITATGASMPGVSRPLCPYPAHPQYDGTGNMDEAASFECRQ